MALQTIVRVFRRRESLSDNELVSLAKERDEDAVRILVRRYNQRLFRIARGIIRDDAEAEDVVRRRTCARSPTSIAFAARRHFRLG